MDDLTKKIAECKRKIALDKLDLWYQLATIQILTDEEDEKYDRILSLKHLQIKEMDVINKLAKGECDETN